MNIKSDIEIAQEHTPKKITEIAAAAGIDEKYLELYGNYKAKVDIQALKDLPRKSKLVLVTAISPTPAGEGKTTTSVGLADALNRLGKRTIVCLREPSLGPAAVTLRSSPWRTSTCTSPATSTPSALRTT